MSKKMSRLVWMASSMLFTSISHAGATSYKYTDLGTNGQTSSFANAINKAGQIAGTTVGSDGYPRATIWKGATALDLGFGQATDINDAGQVVGYAYASPQAFEAGGPALWNGTTATMLPNPVYPDSPPVPNLGRAIALGINNAGVIVGQGAYGAVMWRNGTPIGLPSAFGGPRTVAADINNLDQSVGTASPAKVSYDYAVLWNGTNAVRLPGVTYGDVEGNAQAFAINDKGVAVGAVSGNVAGFGALMWKDGTVIQLGGQGGAAVDINNADQVVGHAAGHAVIWNGTAITDLDSYLDAAQANAGWVLTSANGINDAGAIVGTATNTKTQVTHAFLLTPVDLACTATYKVTKTQAFSFAVQVTVANVSSAALSNWTMGWTYSAKTLLLSVKNAKVTLSGGTAVAASPVAANKTIAANGNTVFTFTGLKGSQLPTPSSVRAALGGNACAVTVQ